MTAGSITKSQVENTLGITDAREIACLQGIIANALAAMDEGRMGDVRRILKTGSDKPVSSASGVLVPNGGAV